MGIFDDIVGGIKDAVGGLLSPINEIGKAAGGILGAFGLDGIVGGLAGMLGKIPGINSVFGGVLSAVPDLLSGNFDLEDAFKVGAMFLPPPAGQIASMVDLDNLAGSVLGTIGGIDSNSAGGKNLLAFAQNAAFEIAGLS